MAKQLGRSFIIKIGDGAGSEAFTTLAGVNSKSLTINNGSIDATTADASTPGGALYRQSLNGLKSYDLTGDGIFLDETAEARLRTVADAADSSCNLQVILPDFGTYSGNFRVENLEFGGETEGAVTFSASFSSNGTISFAAA